MDTACNQLHRLADMQDHARLMQYASENGPFSVKQVQQRGACMFAAIQRCMNCLFKWTNTHLLCQVVVHIVHNVEFLYPIISTHFQGNYDHLRIPQEEYNTKKGWAPLSPKKKRILRHQVLLAWSHT